MDLTTLLPRNHILIGFAGDNRLDIFRHLAEPMVNDGIVTDLDGFVADLERREDEITTQVESGIAFPHARSHTVRRLALTVGISHAEGVLFDPHVDEHCRIFFLLAVPAFAPTAHLPVLQRLANFVSDLRQINKLLACKTPAQATRCLLSYQD